VQMPYIDRLCDALRVPVIKLSRYEADDILGTLARQAVEKGLQTVIVTSDKDLAQLVVDPAIQILRVDKTGEMMLDEAGVKAKYGVHPNQIVDWIGLMGDAVDGIPGAPGIGEKGAVQLLEEFGSIEGALEGWEKVKKKTYRESLRDFAEQIRVSRELARIDLKVAVELNLDALTLKEPDACLAYDLFSELEFAQLTREFADGATKEKSKKTGLSEENEYNRLTKTEELRTLVDSLFNRDRFGFSLAEGPAGRLSGVAFSTAPNAADYFDLENSDDRQEAVRLLKEIFDNGLIEKSTYYLKRAYHLLEADGIRVENATDDAMLQAYLIEPERSRYDMTSLANEFLSSQVELDEENRIAQEADLSLRLADVLSSKIGEDSIQFDFQQEKLDFLYREIEMPLVPLLYEMECAGFRIDPTVLAGLSVEMEQELEKLTGKIHQLAGREFNIASTAQLGEIFEELNFEVSRRTSTGKISTSRDILDELAGKYELPRLIIEHRELSKLKGTYVDTLPSLISPEDG
ncbi:MAG: hypothetical protein J2P31_20525, partial [Blastocatellia bacterium]|nr:hypothetical protein [Blastocatellia bacterium]